MGHRVVVVSGVGDSFVEDNEGVGEDVDKDETVADGFMVLVYSCTRYGRSGLSNTNIY